MRTREFIEKMLDARRITILQPSGRTWSCRRNGATKTWKTRPNDFCIPIKFGFKSYGYIDQDNLNSHEIVILED